MIGFDEHDISKSKGYTILKLNFEASKIKHMGCSSNCTFLVLNQDISSSGSSDDKINPPKQDGDGLLHYYKNDAGNLIELKLNEYEAQK